MNFFEVVDNGQIIDAGFVYLYWDERQKRLYGCDVKKAEYLQSYNGQKIYHANWMKPLKSGSPACEEVHVIEIPYEKYDEIVATLDNGETPEEEEPAPYKPVPSKDETKPMSISEMRETIEEQRQQIDMLTECILEMSEIVYGM